MTGFQDELLRLWCRRVEGCVEHGCAWLRREESRGTISIDPCHTPRDIHLYCAVAIRCLKSVVEPPNRLANERIPGEECFCIRVRPRLGGQDGKSNNDDAEESEHVEAVLVHPNTPVVPKEYLDRPCGLCMRVSI